MHPAPIQKHLSSKSEDLLAKIFLSISLLIFIVWMVYLDEIMPPIIRADYIMILFESITAIEGGKIRDLVDFVFRIRGGHIIAYQSIVSLINWYIFDYSGLFDKFIALVAYIISWIALYHAVKRSNFSVISAGIVLIFGTMMLCNAVYAISITWPDGTISYNSTWIALFFGMPALASVISRPTIGIAGWAKIMAISFLILIGNGSGWSIVPLLPVLYLIGQGYVDTIFHGKHSSRALLISAVAFALICVAFVASFQWFARWGIAYFTLSVAYDSVSTILDNPGGFVSYLLATIASPIVTLPVGEAMWYGLAILMIWSVIIAYIVVQRRSRELILWMGISGFGLLGAVLNALARWRYVMVRSEDVAVPGHYGIFVAPLLVGMVALAAQIVTIQARPAPGILSLRRKGFLLLLPVLAVFAIQFGQSFRQGMYNSRAEGKQHLDARFGAQNYHAIHMARFGGEFTWFDNYTSYIIPYLKRNLKYREMTVDFIDDPAGFIIKERIDLAAAKNPSGNSASCAQDATSLLHAGRDDRSAWSTALRKTPLQLVWVYGYAFEEDCSTPVDYLFVTDVKGIPLCVSRPGPPMMSDLPVEDERRLTPFSVAVFNFSCPALGDYAAGQPYTVYAWSKPSRSLVKVGMSGS